MSLLQTTKTYEVSIERLRKPLMVAVVPESEEWSAKIILWEKGSKTKYSVPLLALYGMLVRDANA